MDNKRRIFRVLILLLPAAIGTLGFALDDIRSVFEGMFQCFTMYALNYTEVPPNALVNIARWLAPVATTSGILLAITSVKERISAWFVSRHDDSFAVYGPQELQDQLLSQLGNRGIRGGDRLVSAGNYILAGEEQENLSFYARHRAELKDKAVFLKCRSMQTQAEVEANVKLFSPEELAARLFWKEAFLYPDSVQRGHRFSIVLIGFGTLGEELLYWGLQQNLFSPDQEITYHVFGDCGEFLNIHPGMKNIRDRVEAHEEPWHQALDVLRGAGRILILDQERQIELLQKLLLIPDLPKIVCFSDREAFAELFEEGSRVSFFPWQIKANRIEYITEERMVRLAKTVNLRYAHLYDGVEETEEMMEQVWKQRDTFTRYSNISSADYHEMRLKILRYLDLPLSLSELPESVQDQMAELEHERWCRYHYLNNWTYGIPDSGKAKDPVRRIHADLIPFSELPVEERKKDYDTVGVMMSI